MFNMLVSKVLGKANLRKPNSCRNCVHNMSGYCAIVCDIHPVDVACYSSELVCDDHTPTKEEVAMEQINLPCTQGNIKSGEISVMKEQELLDDLYKEVLNNPEALSVDYNDIEKIKTEGTEDFSIPCVICGKKAKTCPHTSFITTDENYKLDSDTRHCKECGIGVFPFDGSEVSATEKHLDYLRNGILGILDQQQNALTTEQWWKNLRRCGREIELGFKLLEVKEAKEAKETLDRLEKIWRVNYEIF